MHVHFIQHELFEAPGAFLIWAKRKGLKTTFSKVFEYEPLPDSIDGIDILIVLGGPQNPNTTLEECPHFNVNDEISFIKKCIKNGKAVIGVCLGSQLIGHALGSEFEHSPESEIGVFPIQLTNEGSNDEMLQHFISPLFVGHWHNDMPGLTPDCKILATSEGCPRQIVAYSDRVYGFQCHLELTREVVELLIANDEDILKNNSQHRFIQEADEILNYNYTEMNNNLYLFLDKFITKLNKEKETTK